MWSLLTVVVLVMVLVWVAGGIAAELRTAFGSRTRDARTWADVSWRR